MSGPNGERAMSVHVPTLSIKVRHGESVLLEHGRTRALVEIDEVPGHARTVQMRITAPPEIHIGRIGPVETEEKPDIVRNGWK